jgi:hypothetical protein
VFSPLVSPRTKKAYKPATLGIKSGDVWSLVEIAEAARQSQVAGLRLAAMLPRNDMFYVKSNESRRRLGQAAVLANVAGPRANERSKGLIHHDRL